MAQTILPVSDYTALVKEYIPRGQQKSLWENFLLGTEQTYQGISQQAKDIAAYDISEAYANYKQQQLQLKMNEQLGAGFQQQIGGQLQSAYGSAYADIRTQEATDLANIEAKKLSTIEKGEEQFTELGKQLRTYDKLISEYAELAGISRPANATITTRDEYGVTTEELTDYGRLWYSDVLSAVSSEGTFDKWLLNEMSSSAVDYEDRVAFWEAYRQNPELFRQQVAGIGADFNAEATRTRLAKEEHTTALTNIQSALNEELKNVWSDASLADLTTEQLLGLKSDFERNPNLVSSASAAAVKDAKGFLGNEPFRDNYGRLWDMTNRSNTINNAGGRYRVGDIIRIDGKYAVVTNTKSGKVSYTYVKKWQSVENPTGPTIKPIFPGY